MFGISEPDVLGQITGIMVCLTCAILCNTVPNCAILCHTVPYCAILCHTVPYCAILCHTVPYCAILCHTVPYCATLCHTVPYCAILCEQGKRGCILKHLTSSQRPELVSLTPNPVSSHSGSDANMTLCSEDLVRRQRQTCASCPDWEPTMIL